MIRLAAKLFAIFIVGQIVSLVSSQPIPLTQWEQISPDRVTFDSPRMARFSDGSYVVVYVLAGVNSNSAVGTIFGPDGAVKVPVFLLPDNSATSNVAPRVFVFSDDMFLTAWRDTQFNEIRAKMWHQNGTAATNQFRISLNAVPPKTTSDSFEIAAMPNDRWVFAYAGSTAYVSIHWFDVKQSVTPEVRNLDALPGTHLGLAVSFFENQIYLFYESAQDTINSNQLSIFFNNGYQNYIGALNGATPQRPFTTVMSNGMIPVLWYSDLDYGALPSSIGLNAVGPGLVVEFTNFTVVNNMNANDGAVNPNAVDLGNDRLLVVYEGTYNNVTRPVYRIVLVSSSDQNVRTSPLGPETFDDSVIISPFMITTIRSEVVVVAINETGRSIVRRVLTFCGNSAVELREECDGTEFCSETCQCELGFIGRNGRCVPDCGDGLVVGSEQCDSGTDGSCDNDNCVCAAGYIPIVPRQNGCTVQPATFRPSVGPTLDCIVPGQVPVAHFSFLNEDGFAQTIPYGDSNQFIPNNVGANRPTQFAAGASLTYPAAPFRLQLPTDLQSFTWLLGQFNLTVDLSNITALSCPRDISFFVRVVTSDVLNEDLVQIFLNNFARRYGISVSRLTATITLNNPGPAERRRAVQQAATLYDYTVTVTVAPSVTNDEPSSEEAVNDFFTEYKNETRQDEINNDLTEGLESVNPQVKEVTPAPTGVSVRSEKFETPPVAESPQAVTQPVKLSSASTGVIFHSFVFLFVSILVL